MPTDIGTIATVVAVLTTLAAILLGYRWTLAKTKLHEFRAAIDAADDALKDDKVTEDEWRTFWQKILVLAGKG